MLSSGYELATHVASYMATSASGKVQRIVMVEFEVAVAMFSQRCIGHFSGV